MAKVAMECPFSNQMCRDCAVYRGSHYYLCFKKEYRGCLVGDQGNGSRRTMYGLDDLSFGLPEDLQFGSNVISDVEDMIEEEEFGKIQRKA